MNSGLHDNFNSDNNSDSAIISAESVKDKNNFLNFFIFFIIIEMCWLMGTKVSEFLLDLQLNNLEFGQIQSAEQFYHYSVAATVLIWGYFIDRYPEKRKICLIISNLIWISGSFYLYFTQMDYIRYIMVQILWGLSYGANGALIGSYLGDLLAIQNRGKLFSLFMIFIYIIKGSSIAVTGLIGDALNSWTAPSLIFAIIGLVVLIIFIKFGRPPKLAAVEPEFKEKISKGELYQYRLEFNQIGEILKKLTNILFILQGISGMIGVTIVTRYLNYWFTSNTGMGLDSFTSAILLGVSVWLGALLGLNIAGRWVDSQFKKNKIRSILYFATAALFLQVFSYFILTQLIKYPESVPVIIKSLPDLLNYYPIFYLFMIVFNICIFFGTTIAPTLSAARTHINLPEHRGTVAAIYDLFDFIGSGIALVLGSAIFTITGESYQNTIMLGASFWIISGILWIVSTFTIERDYRKLRNTLAERVVKATGDK